ncbi:elastin isoform X1 [Rattus norvegicus]|uniref:FKBP prolyl isomerase 2 like 1 n=1 Tax=Rattus norvegicus TaxID=10116 RepID=A0ABK0L7T5_RAT|nr:elastin [Rattus norvegicus]
MPQGAGSHAVRGGALGLGAGRGTAVGGTTESVRAKGRTQWPIAGLGGVGGGVWNLEEELEQVEGGALGSETEGVRSQALGVGLQPGSGVAPVQETKSNISEGVATGEGAELHALKGGAKEPCGELSVSYGPGRPRGGGLRGGRAWGRGRPRTPPGEVVWVERARRPADSEPVWVPRRPPRAQSWGGAPGGGGTGPDWGVPPEDRGSSEPPSGDVWVPRGRPPAAAAEVWVCWTGSSWVWREWGRPVGTNPVQSDRVWTLRKGASGN